MRDDGNDSVGDRELDVELARRAVGFRWVRWNELTAGAKAMEYENGRFLASPDHVAAAHHTEAIESEPLAPAWDRFVPAFSRRVGPALDAAERAGLFLRDVTLRHGDDGRWTLQTKRSDGLSIAVEARTLPELLCLAVLEAIEGAEGADGR